MTVPIQKRLAMREASGQDWMAVLALALEAAGITATVIVLPGFEAWMERTGGLRSPGR
jgi:rhodanese-related sulfurtransferase